MSETKDKIIKKGTVYYFKPKEETKSECKTSIWVIIEDINISQMKRTYPDELRARIALMDNKEILYVPLTKKCIECIGINIECGCGYFFNSIYGDYTGTSACNPNEFILTLIHKES